MDDDNMSQASWSAASESDRMLFTVLSNTERLDVERLPRVNGAPSPPRELPTVVEEDESRHSAPRDGDMIADEIVREMERDSEYHSAGRHEFEPPSSEVVAPQAGEIAREDERHTSREDSQRYSSSFDPYTSSRGHEEDHHGRESNGDGGADTRDDHHRTSSEDHHHPREEDTGGEHRSSVEREERRGPEYEREQMLEKQSTLYDLNQLESRGVRLSRKWSMDDSLDDMTHELRHHLLVLDERENVGMMKNGLKMALTGIEIVNTRFNLLDLEGWSTQAASELDRQDGNLSRIYRKYWRRSTSNNPESEILFSLFSSMGMYHMKRSMARQMMNRNTRPSRPRQRRVRDDDSSSDDERPPV